MNFFTELKRRKVFRVAVVYAATAFAVLQAADIMLPRVGVPDWVMNLVVVLSVLGFPIALVLAWALELKPDGGIQRTEAEEAGTTESPPLLGARTLIAAGLLVALGVGLGAGWLLKPGTEPGQSATADASPIGSQRQSVAVLPFDSLSDDAEQGYFADGLTEEILNSLAALPELLVTARTSSFYFKGKDTPIPEIAETLGVAHVVEGSVRRAGDNIRVTAQLIRAADGFHLWSNSYGRPLENVFDIQTDIAESVAEALSVFIDDDERAAILATGTRNVEAFQAFLRGQDIYRRAHARDEDVNLWDANEHYEHAMRLDPDYVAPAIGAHDAYAHYLTEGPRSDFLGDVADRRAPESAAEARRLLNSYLDRAARSADSDAVRLIAELNKVFFSRDWSRTPGLVDALKRAATPQEIAAVGPIWATHLIVLSGNHDFALAILDAETKRNPLGQVSWSLKIQTHAAAGDLQAARRSGAAARLALGESRFLRIRDVMLAATSGDLADTIAALEALDAAASPTDSWRLPYLTALNGDYAAAEGIVDDVLAQGVWPEAWTLLVFLETGNDERARALTRRIDALDAGAGIFARDINAASGHLFFDLADAPNFAARLEEAGIDPAKFRPMPRLSARAD